ncbi:DUF2306 domain-containing protein [Sulfitobacter sp. 20_GPM-1509m]|uniref:DUF2306 domain-containing protein n=1 Tax=Sulfitobacter sp. 20_GPM-1509m TaxID=1380367 RepID=UPI00056AC8BD|nr:DUF2306 domain-containing protein [Sulfitobacter sp. 20_GPM-1509m]|tara:strand:- start:2146 stop:2550 length:405 start_codon:yes stop_codon:yes gene_type:complete
MSVSVQPLVQAGPTIFIHATLAIGALVLGIWQMLATKGTPQHRLIGRVWVGIMAIVALSSFWIHEFRLFGPFSPIHILSAITLVSLPFAVRAARQGNINKHRRMMRMLFFIGLLVPGAFTLLPGRVMHAVFFGG